MRIVRFLTYRIQPWCGRHDILPLVFAGYAIRHLREIYPVSRRRSGLRKDCRWYVYPYRVGSSRYDRLDEAIVSVHLALDVWYGVGYCYLGIFSSKEYCLVCSWISWWRDCFPWKELTVSHHPDFYRSRRRKYWPWNRFIRRNAFGRSYFRA